MRAVQRWVPVSLLVLLSLVLVHDAEAWGDLGHAIICELAFQELTPQAREAVQGLIRQDPDFTRFAQACTWPAHPRKRAGEHFVNLPRSAARLGDQPCPVDAPCVVTAIEADFAALTQPGATDAEKLAALKFLGHWVGDVHQPLHVSFQDARGGNEIVTQGPCTQLDPPVRDLHAVWDTCLITHTLGTDSLRIATDLRAAVTDAERTQWTSTRATVWANESFAITTAAAVRYCMPTATSCRYEAANEALERDEEKKIVTVDEAYLAQHRPTVTRRLTQAGVRLGALLNQALGRP
jgi:hypothetical protein